MTFFSKVKWVASIMLVFSIVLITNLIDKENFNQLSYSVKTIYEDRIVASDLLFEISLLIQEKEVAIISEAPAFFQGRNKQVDLEIGGLIGRYEQTQLTEQEKFIFKQLKEELKELKEREHNFVNSANNNDNNLLELTSSITQHLHDLSKIQVKEGRRQVSISNNAMDAIDLFTQVEIVFLIVMAILVQVIILYKPKES
jgi:hypothetical protein